MRVIIIDTYKNIYQKIRIIIKTNQKFQIYKKIYMMFITIMFYIIKLIKNLRF